MKRTICILMVSACAWLAVRSITAQTKKISSSEPSVFSPEEGDNSVFHNAPLPSDAVLDALLKTPEARESADELQKLRREEQRNLFRVVEVHLAKQDEVHWIVSGSGPMSGADNDWFWVVREKGNQAEVLLFANGLVLSTLKSRTNDYKDIETSWSGASGPVITLLYQYDGKQYKLIHKQQRKRQLQ